MSAFWTSAPALKRAALHIAYDNGLVDRYHSEEAFLAKTEWVLLQYTVPQIMAAERDLAAMTDEQLEHYCVGGDDGTRTGPTDDMLNLIFEGG